MDHFREYLAAEVALDHVDGRISRREALRQLGSMGLTALAAAALLAACGKEKKQAATAPASTAAGPTTSTTAGLAPLTTTARPATTPVPTQEITYPGPTSTLMGAYATAAAPKGAVLVVHQNQGLVDNVRAVASRLAGDGYSALAVDLLSEEGGTAAVPSGNVNTALTSAGKPRIRADLHATLDELAKRNPGAKLGMIGFCFGGTVAWDFLTDGDPRLAAAAPFYGAVTFDMTFEKNKAAVLGIYAVKDARVNATREDARAALDKTSVPHQLLTYPDVDHGFYTSDTGSQQSQAAYSSVLDWYGRYLK